MTRPYAGPDTADVTVYKSGLDQLMYLMVHTCPNIAFAV